MNPAVKYLGTVGLLLAVPSAASDLDPWAAMTARDVEAIHSLVQNNHPGSIDAANPFFRKWLETGHQAAEQDASLARSLGDYQRTVRRYINGFRDNHMRIRFENGTDQAMWPSFSVQWQKDGRFIVTLSRTPQVPVGASVVSCEGVPLAIRMERDILPFMWNPELPYAKRPFAANLFIADATMPRPSRCRIVAGKTTASAEITLDWQPLTGREAAQLRRETNGLEIPPLGIRDIGDVTFISLPSMDASDKLPQFFQDVEAQAETLHRRPFVLFDVRGNTGGNTSVGYRLLRILYGTEPINRLVNSFDWTNDVRATPSNAARYRATADTMQASGAFPQREVDAVRAVGDKIDAAVARGEPFLHGGQPPGPLSGPSPISPFSGRVFLLTDSACASACLDFADVARRLPGLVHIGLPTEADATYMESRHEILPSGLARLTFGIKVVRNRIRKNNEWYEPKYRWPGGQMSDEAIAKWVQSLH